tara:strand:+ start:5306 stop:6346 length:1041 start_codon:yes stop_codon:yes gene_type:complete
MNRTAIAILRLVNAATRLTNPMDRRRYIREKIKTLSDEDKKALSTALKTMILMTSGNVKTIRDPSLYDPSAGSWRSISSPSAMEVLNQMPDGFGGFGPGYTSPTMDDYETAKKLMPILGSSFMDVDEVKALTGGGSPEEELFYKLDAAKGFEILYRGISGLKIDTVKYAMENSTWDMSRGVSTSFNPRESENFAGIKQYSHGAVKNRGPSMYFVINNPKRKGFVSDAISEYDEQEVILSGIVDIDSWEFQASGRAMPAGSSIGHQDPKKRPFMIKATLNNKEQLMLETMSGNSMEFKLLPDQLDRLLDGNIIIISNKFKFLPPDIDMLPIKLTKKSMLLRIQATLK